MKMMMTKGMNLANGDKHVAETCEATGAFSDGDDFWGCGAPSSSDDSVYKREMQATIACETSLTKELPVNEANVNDAKECFRPCHLARFIDKPNETSTHPPGKKMFWLGLQMESARRQ